MPAGPGDQGSVAASYDAVAELYAANVGGELDTRPLERGMLAAFATLVGPDGRVLDIGCGPGHVTGYLANLGLAASGVDLSAGMVAAARARSPELTFEVASMLALTQSDSSLDGALAWFSLIHLDGDQRPQAYEQFARIVRPGGWLMVGFHVEGDVVDGYRAPGETARLTRWWELDVNLDFHFLDPAVEIPSLQAAGWHIVARMDREPMIPTEPQTRRCYLLARRADSET